MAAAAAERARLARAVHDGVLQVLALVQRRGAESSGDLVELGRMAGEQEAALRSLIRQQDVQESTGATDLASALEELTRTTRAPVTVSTPGVPVELPARVVAELVAAVMKVEVALGQEVAADDAVVILESMKMEIPVLAEVSGSVIEIVVSDGDVVNEGDPLVIIRPR